MFVRRLITGAVAAGIALHCTTTPQLALAQATEAATKMVDDPTETTLKVVRVKATGVVDATENTGSYITGPSSTPTRLNLSLRQTPQSISVITRQQMDDQGLTSVGKVLERTVGVTLNQAETDRVFPIVRGFEVTNIQYDGIPSEAGGSYDDDLLVDTAIYDRVEVVRGATGLLTGVGSPSAAVNLVRKRPTPEFQGYVSGSAGTWDNYRGELDVSGALTDGKRIRGRFVGAFQDRDSPINEYSNDRSVLYGIVEADITETTLLTAGLDYQNSHSNGMTYGEPVPLFFSDGGRTHFSRSTTTGNDWTYLDKHRLLSFASVEQQFGDGWMAKLMFTNVDADLANRMNYISGYPDRVTGSGMDLGPNSFDSTHKQNAVDLYASGPFSLLGREHELVLGWSYNEDKTDRKGNEILSQEPFDSFYNLQNYPSPVFGEHDSWWGWQTRQDGAYTALRLQLADPLKLIIGGRISNVTYSSYSEFGGYPYTKGSNTYSSEITPYAGLVYDFAEHYSAYASYTEIFQTQEARDRNNHILDPLTGTNYELGVKGELFAGRLNVSVALFKIEQDNFAVVDEDYVPVAPLFEERYKGISGTEVRGYELEISGEPLPNWNISGGFTRRIAKDAEGSNIQTIEPQLLLRLTSSYRLPGAMDKLSLGGHVSWQSEIYNDGIGPNGERASQEAYSVLDLFGNYKVNEQLSVQLNLNNVLDKDYYKSVGFYGGGFYGEPRNVAATVKYKL